jgi:hypothetical protein
MNIKLNFICGISLVLLQSVAHANAGVLQISDSETAVCTVVKRVSIDLTKPLTVSNPIEGLATQPTVCNGRAMTKLEYNDGIRSLMGMGWQVTSASHQITPLGSNSASGNTELLLSSLFTIQRNTTNKINNFR